MKTISPSSPAPEFLYLQRNSFPHKEMNQEIRSLVFNGLKLSVSLLRIYKEIKMEGPGKLMIKKFLRIGVHAA
jgi:hypothetical protein